MKNEKWENERNGKMRNERLTLTRQPLHFTFFILH
jgi:hypothetical protein